MKIRIENLPPNNKTSCLIILIFNIFYLENNCKENSHFSYSTKFSIFNEKPMNLTN